ncbi:hypothetical protein F5050DRAFT_415344 [Lentinula boryana]|uniref:Uncharacterized protein n=1 Tax=Lentinula boryana TaxID=40481 RepID=A0ABQ8Q8P4_9AGAR|nr:hypothetical protein F5050DRAFT_415344 [Lentinula boryana]
MLPFRLIRSSKRTLATLVFSSLLENTKTCQRQIVPLFTDNHPQLHPLLVSAFTRTVVTATTSTLARNIYFLDPTSTATLFWLSKSAFLCIHCQSQPFHTDIPELTLHTHPSSIYSPASSPFPYLSASYLPPCPLLHPLPCPVHIYHSNLNTNV